jgi:hypothetical protein
MSGRRSSAAGNQLAFRIEATSGTPTPEPMTVVIFSE